MRRVHKGSLAWDPLSRSAPLCDLPIRCHVTALRLPSKTQQEMTKCPEVPVLTSIGSKMMHKNQDCDVGRMKKQHHAKCEKDLQVNTIAKSVFSSNIKGKLRLFE